MLRPTLSFGVLLSAAIAASTPLPAAAQTKGKTEAKAKGKTEAKAKVDTKKVAADLASVLAPEGPLVALRRAKDEGLVKFVGVTGHEDPQVMKAAIESDAFDSVLIPLNPVDLHWASFVDGTLPTAVAKGIARVGMKVFASGRLVRTAGGKAKGLSAEDCLRFAYGLDVSSAIVGCSTIAEVDEAVRVAAEAKPLDASARAALIADAKRFTGNSGAGVEWYKRPA